MLSTTRSSSRLRSLVRSPPHLQMIVGLQGMVLKACSPCLNQCCPRLSSCNIIYDCAPDSFRNLMPTSKKFLICPVSYFRSFSLPIAVVD